MLQMHLRLAIFSGSSKSLLALLDLTGLPLDSLRRVNIEFERYAGFGVFGDMAIERGNGASIMISMTWSTDFVI